MEKLEGQHSYKSFSWRGSFPTFRCRYCGVDSQSAESRKPCPADPRVAPGETATDRDMVECPVHRVEHHWNDYCPECRAAEAGL